MGVSADAILAYGIEAPWDEGEAPWDAFDDMEDWLVATFNPDARTGPYDWHYTALDAVPIELVTHCSDGYPMWLLVARGHCHVAPRGSVIPLGTTIAPPGDTSAFLEACRSLGVTEEPQWLLAPWYG